jgi:putative transposon-encoded protein
VNVAIKKIRSILPKIISSGKVYPGNLFGYSDKIFIPEKYLGSVTF